MRATYRWDTPAQVLETDDDPIRTLLARSEETTAERLLAHQTIHRRGADREQSADCDEEKDYSLKGCHFFKPAEVYVT